MPSPPRSLHRSLALFVLPFLLSTIVSGMVYRVSRAVFSASKESVGWLMSLHQLSFLGLAAIFPVALCVAVLVMAGSGLSMVQLSNVKMSGLLSGNTRVFHRAIGPVALIPLVVTAVSGGIFVVCTKWLNYSRQSVKILLDIHQGSWIMPPYIYVLIVGSLSLAVLLSGVRTHPFFQKKFGSTTQVDFADMMEMAFNPKDEDG